MRWKFPLVRRMTYEVLQVMYGALMTDFLKSDDRVAKLERDVLRLNSLLNGYKEKMGYMEFTCRQLREKLESQAIAKQKRKRMKVNP